MTKFSAVRPASRHDPMRSAKASLVSARAALVEDDENRWTGSGEDRRRLFGAPVGVASRPALGDFDGPRTPECRASGPTPPRGHDSGRRGRAPARPSAGRRRSAQAARDAGQTARCSCGRLGAPHLLEIVEAANLGPEDVDRARRRRRSAPSRRPAGLRPARVRSRFSLMASSTRSAIAPTWRWERPEVMIMVSAIEVLPARSISTVSSAFMSSRQARAIGPEILILRSLAPEGGGSEERSASRRDNGFSSRPSFNSATRAPPFLR